MKEEGDYEQEKGGSTVYGVKITGVMTIFDILSVKPQIQVHNEGNSTPLKVLMPSSFTSQQLVFLAGTLKPKGFVPCILAMREDCILGQRVWH